MELRQGKNKQSLMTTNIVVNLRECKYDVFRRVAQEHYKWETLLPYEYYLQQQQQLQLKRKASEESGDGCDQQVVKIQQLSERSQPTNKKDARVNAISPQISQQWDILWIDHGGLTPEFLSSMLPWQRVNHFLGIIVPNQFTAGMYNIARKNTLGIHLKRFMKEFPKDYNFFPNTWLYPTDFFEINEYYDQKVAKRKQKLMDGTITENQAAQDPVVLFICKPEASCQGKGIFIVRRMDEMRQQLNSYLQAQYKQFQEYIQAQEFYDTALYYSQKPIAQSTQNAQQQSIFSVNYDQSQLVSPQPANQQQSIPEPPQYVEKNNTYVIQKYLKHPALINGHKFDFRIYVLITSVIEPLTIFVYQDGLVRLASEKYELNGANIQDSYIHLTNYSLNKRNSNFDNERHKLKLSECLRNGFTSQSEKGTFVKTSQQIWKEINDIVIKTIITIQPQLQHYYRMSQPKEPDLCYELLGFDIMLDNKLKPWLIEVNHLPSFNSDTQTDEQVKYELIRDIFNILELSINHRKKVYKEMKADQLRQSQQQGCYKRLSVKEHCDRVRFDPKSVEKSNPNNKFKLVYPVSKRDDDYEKFQRKANEIWQMTTGTYRQQQQRKQSQLQPQRTIEQINERKKSSDENEDNQYDQNITIEDLNNKMKQINENFHELKILSASAETKDSITLLNEKRMTTEQSANSTQQAFFEKRQSTTLKSTIPDSCNPKSKLIQKQNSQRYQFKKHIRQAQSNPRASLTKQHNQASSIKRRQLRMKNKVEEKSDNDSKDDKMKEDDDIDKINHKVVNEDHDKNTDSILEKNDMNEFINRLQLNNGKLKYKEYCKALIDDFNQSYYKSSYNQKHKNKSGFNQQQKEGNSRSISQGITSLNQNINTLVIPPQTTNPSISSINFYNLTNPSNLHNNHFCAHGNNNFLKKLHHVIHSTQARQQSGGLIGRTNRQGLLISSLISPSGALRNTTKTSTALSKRHNHHPFTQSVTKGSKEELAIYNVAKHQRVLLRSDSINTVNKGGLDMAPINMSAGVVDFKYQYKKLQRRFAAATANNTGTQIRQQHRKGNQSRSLNNQYKSQVSPKIIQ